MLTIGLTGGVGSGKSTVAKYFAELGIDIIDTDEIAREVVNPDSDALKEITAHFGPTILNPDKTLDRKKLRSIIFKNKMEREWLEQLLHPLIRKKTQEKIRQSHSPYCVVVIPLLVETAPNTFIQRVLVIDAPEEQQLLRIQKRDDITKTDAEAIIKAQASRENRLAKADDIIKNHDDIDDLKRQVIKLHEFYLSIANELKK